MCVNHNPYFLLIMTIFGIEVTDVWNALYYSPSNRNKYNILGVRVSLNLLYEYLLNNLDSNLSPDYVLSKLPFLGPLPRGDGYSCLLYADLFPGGRRYHTFSFLGFQYIEMVETNISYTTVLYITNYVLHILKRYEEKLGDKYNTS